MRNRPMMKGNEWLINLLQSPIRVHKIKGLQLVFTSRMTSLFKIVITKLISFGCAARD